MNQFQITGDGLTKFIESCLTDNKIDLAKVNMEFSDLENCYQKIEELKKKILNPAELFENYSRRKVGEITFFEF